MTCCANPARYAEADWSPEVSGTGLTWAIPPHVASAENAPANRKFLRQLNGHLAASHLRPRRENATNALPTRRDDLMPSRRSMSAWLGLLLAAAMVAAPATAQDYPARPVRIKIGRASGREREELW